MNNQEILSYINLLSALVVPMTAIIVAYIAYQQWQTAKRQLKHDLYDKRFVLYKATQGYVSTVLTGYPCFVESTHTYLEDINGSQWLVNKKLSNYLKVELVNNANELKYLKDEGRNYAVGKERSLNVKKQRELIDWFEQQKEYLIKQFECYLNI